MSEFVTEQEAFWAGEFGTEYISRNADDAQTIAHSVGIWASILQSINSALISILELGANIGINLDALTVLQPSAHCSAVEINANAVMALRKRKRFTVYHDSILTFVPQGQWGFGLYFWRAHSSRP